MIIRHPLFQRTAFSAVLLLTTSHAAALGIATGIPEIDLRWDNTVRYTAGMRVNDRNDRIANTAIADEGTWSFDKGDLVTNRIDLLSELDLTYRNFGVRVSGAGWYDDAYGDHSHTNPNPPLSQIGSYVDGEYTHEVKRHYQGPSGELLDALAFAKFSVDETPISAKAGRHAVYWGESLLLNGAMHGIAYGQVPLDLQKGLASPGIEAKELFRPLNQLSFQTQLTNTLSVAGQYFLEWEASRFPEGGTYLGPIDFVFEGPDRQFLGPALGFGTRGKSVEPDQRNEWGLATRWSPAALDGTVGFYYRRYADKMPQVLLTRVAPGQSVYNLMYADGIDLFGVSLSKQVAGVSLGAEFSYRHDTPLSSQVLGVSPIGQPDRGETAGARGDTLHAVVNAIGVVPKTVLFDTASWATEFTWSQWTKVRSGEKLFNAEGFAPCTGKDKWDGCATRNFVGGAFNFTPTWFQVVPNVDLLAPMSVSSGLLGNAATAFGGNQANGSYTIGVAADVQQRFRFDLKYIDYFGRTEDNGVSVTSQNGFTTLLKDRGYIAFTVKTTF